MVYETSKEPIVFVLMEPISQNRHKMTQIWQISIKIKVPQKEFKIAKFNKPDIDNQMSGTYGQYEPLYTPWNVFFSFVIAQYFISFLFEHTVFTCQPHKKPADWGG